MQSAYHNLPTIGGVMQHSSASFQATDRKFSSDNDRATYSFNIADAYPKEAGVKSHGSAPSPSIAKRTASRSKKILSLITQFLSPLP